MKISAVQFDIVWENPAENFAKVTELLEQSQPAEESLVALPEMFATGFSMNRRATLGAHDETAEFLADLARQFSVSVCGGIVSPGQTGKPLNQALLLDKDGHATATATKLHSFTFSGENEHYASGSDVVVTDFARAKLSMLICYDLRFPESFRKPAGLGAEIFLVLANWPASRREHWLTLLRARAIENQACVVGVNRIGSSPDCDYAGDSIIIGPRGETLAEAGDRECVISADVDIDDLRQYRKDFPALADMKL